MLIYGVYLAKTKKESTYVTPEIAQKIKNSYFRNHDICMPSMEDPRSDSVIMSHDYKSLMSELPCTTPRRRICLNLLPPNLIQRIHK